jgi:hypothetical protein
MNDSHIRATFRSLSFIKISGPPDESSVLIFSDSFAGGFRQV